MFQLLISIIYQDIFRFLSTFADYVVKPKIQNHEKMFIFNFIQLFILCYVSTGKEILLRSHLQYQDIKERKCIS